MTPRRPPLECHVLFEWPLNKFKNCSVLLQAIRFKSIIEYRQIQYTLEGKRLLQVKENFVQYCKNAILPSYKKLQLSKMKFFFCFFQDIHFPFIAELLGTFKNDKFFFMLFPFCIGGELFTHLRRLELNTFKIWLHSEFRAFSRPCNFVRRFCVSLCQIIVGFDSVT